MNKLELLCIALFIIILVGAFICSYVNYNNENRIKQDIATKLCDYQNYSFGYYQTEVTYKDANSCKDVFQDKVVCSDGSITSHKIIYVGEPYKYGYCETYTMW